MNSDIAGESLLGSVLDNALGGLFYFAVFVCVVGTGRKVWQYARTPAPLKVPTTPAPITRLGVVVRMAREVVLFESLFKASRWTWLFGWLFHAGLLLVLLAHLRHFIDPVWSWVWLLAAYSPYFAWAMMFGLAGLLIRRCIVDRVRYISAPSDYLMLILIMLIGGSGLMLRLVVGADIFGIKQFMHGLMSFDIGSAPSGAVLWIHLLLVALLLIIFPFSKLLHMPGLFFSPSRTQVDNPRERRHITRWKNQPSDSKLKGHDYRG